ncbi:unnamed protein product [Thelazia callipaeda]|uniref:MgtE domain-containing protein n=1 Tax=Thelazia callipaeda TaxID=103827 RepID=A0A0N5DCD6_THECL|nr:unnamed protein product [Thelazia callipaeda]
MSKIISEVVNLDSKVALLLIVTAIPYNFLVVIIVIFTAKNVDFSWILVGTYIAVAFIQAVVLFYFCQVTVYWLSWCRMDPDNNLIPLLTSVSDLLGIGLLYSLFILLNNFAPSTIRYERFKTMNQTHHQL